MKAIIPRITWSSIERTSMAEPSTISLGLLQNRIIVFIGSTRLKQEYEIIFFLEYFKHEEMPSVLAFSEK